MARPKLPSLKKKDYTILARLDHATKLKLEMKKKKKKFKKTSDYIRYLINSY